MSVVWVDIADKDCGGCPLLTRCVRPKAWLEPKMCVHSTQITSKALLEPAPQFATVASYSLAAAILLLLCVIFILTIFRKPKVVVVHLSNHPDAYSPDAGIAGDAENGTEMTDMSRNAEEGVAMGGPSRDAEDGAAMPAMPHVAEEGPAQA